MNIRSEKSATQLLVCCNFCKMICFFFFFFSFCSVLFCHKITICNYCLLTCPGRHVNINSHVFLLVMKTQGETWVECWLQKVKRTKADITALLRSVGDCLALRYLCQISRMCLTSFFLFFFFPFTFFRVSDKQTMEEILTPYIHPTESDPVKRQKWELLLWHWNSPSVPFVLFSFPKKKKKKKTDGGVQVECISHQRSLCSSVILPNTYLVPNICAMRSAHLQRCRHRLENIPEYTMWTMFGWTCFLGFVMCNRKVLKKQLQNVGQF